MNSDIIQKNFFSTVTLWTVVQSVAAFLIVYYWEFGWVLFVAYVILKIERAGAYQYLNATEANEHISRLNTQLEHQQHQLVSSKQKEEELIKRIELLESERYQR